MRPFQKLNSVLRQIGLSGIMFSLWEMEYWGIEVTIGKKAYGPGTHGGHGRAEKKGK